MPCLAEFRDQLYALMFLPDDYFQQLSGTAMPDPRVANEQ